MVINTTKIRERTNTGEFHRTVRGWRAFPAAMPEGLGVRFAAPDAAMIAKLESEGNRSDDWSRVLFAQGSDAGRVINCRFSASCYVDVADEKSLLENSRFSNAYVGRGARVLDVSLVDGAVILEGAEVMRVGAIVGGAGHAFGIGTEIVFAPGGGNRKLPALPDIMSGELARLAVLAPNHAEIASYRELVREIADDVRCSLVIIGARASVRNCGTLARCFIGESARLDGCPIIEDSILLSSTERPTTACACGPIRRTITQELCEFQAPASVDSVFMAEASRVAEGARVHSSIIAPNSGVSGGELRYSFLGPFVAFVHEALCIATFWPGGKGNVSYGANIGSNHSGRAPDQEHFAGEGVFYGLACAIKFPFNSVEAPYSLIASGVVCLPQKISFPFSLINTPSESVPGIPPGFNEIIPAWQIPKNIYGLLRKQENCADRNKCKRERLDSRVFRPDLRPLVENAIQAIERGLSHFPAGNFPNGDAFFFEDQMQGIGKNFVREKAARQAIAHYRFALELIDYFGGQNSQSSTDRRRIEARILELMIENRARDDRRGGHIIPDYAAVHGSADDDPMIIRWRQIVPQPK